MSRLYKNSQNQPKCVIAASLVGQEKKKAWVKSLSPPIGFSSEEEKKFSKHLKFTINFSILR